MQIANHWSIFITNILFVFFKSIIHKDVFKIMWIIMIIASHSSNMEELQMQHSDALNSLAGLELGSNKLVQSNEYITLWPMQVHDPVIWLTWVQDMAWVKRFMPCNVNSLGKPICQQLSTLTGWKPMIMHDMMTITEYIVWYAKFWP